MSNQCVVCVAQNRYYRLDADLPMTEIETHPVHRVCQHELESAIRMRPQASLTGDVLKWVSNDRHPFTDLTRLWASLGLATARQVNATEAERASTTARELAAMRAAPPVEPSSEEAHELLCAFGPDVEVTNIITGDTVRTGQVAAFNHLRRLEESLGSE